MSVGMMLLGRMSLSQLLLRVGFLQKVKTGGRTFCIAYFLFERCPFREQLDFRVFEYKEMKDWTNGLPHRHLNWETDQPWSATVALR
jgi:hypothetical protein